LKVVSEDGFGTFKVSRDDGIFRGLLQHGIEIIIKPINGYIPLEGLCLYLNQVGIYTNWLNLSGP
jgi:hypothetical protein